MKNILLIIVMLSFSYGDFDSIVSEELKSKEKALSNKPESQKEEPPVTCDHISNKVVSISTAMGCYNDSYSLYSFENCLRNGMVKLEKPETSIRKSSVVIGNVGALVGGR